MLRIDLTPYGEGTHHLALDAEARDLDLDPAQFSDIRVDVLLDLHNDRVLVTLQAYATATLECDRTLVLFEQPVDGRYRILFAPPALAQSRRGDEEDYEEIRVLEPSDRRIDLTDAVRDTLLLAVPARKVAPGAEEIDLPRSFGVPEGAEDAPVDPRWEALRVLRSGDEQADA